MGCAHAEPAHRSARVLASAAAAVIALSCGTNYGFSAWSPQFAERLQLTATQTNVMGNFGNVGMYAMGIPGGILIDSRGPRWGVSTGCVCLAVGYFMLKRAYDGGAGSMGMPLLCLSALLTGVGSCTAFSAAIKASASNWPTHRGTATAFPLSAFGLSAFFYTTTAGILFPGDTSGYLNILAYGTTTMTFVGMLFLRIVPTTLDHDHVAAYGVVPADDQDQQSLKRDHGESSRLHRTSSKGTQSTPLSRSLSTNSNCSDGADERASLFSSESSTPGDIEGARNPYHNHQRPEITGWALLRTSKFWQLFVLLSLLCGVGLMTINNLGNNVRALWHHYDDRASKDLITKRQLMHVSILSFCSFLGRLASGIGSDWLIHHHASRFWTLVASAAVFIGAQVVAITLEDPRHLYWLSGSTGIAYGVLFGVYPALVADAFGATGLGINWGCMTWAPVLSGNVYNVFYGRVLDRHATWHGNDRRCDAGKDCYASAYWITLGSSVIGALWSLWCIRQEKLDLLRERKQQAREHQP